MLHGSNRTGVTLVEKWKDYAKKENIIIAGPDATNCAAGDRRTMVQTTCTTSSKSSNRSIESTRGACICSDTQPAARFLFTWG